MFSRVICAFVLVAAVGSNLEAQWQKISTPLVEANPRVQAVTFKNGRLWVATQDTLWLTSDNGASWFVRSPEELSEAILTVDFFDENNGILATKRKICRTRDAGLHWDTIYVQGDNCYALKFIHSPLEIAVGANGTCHLMITRDGGLTWDSTDFKDDITNKPADTVSPEYNFEELKDIQTLASGTVKALLLRKGNGGSQIATSHDYGQTWTFSNGFDYDCFSFAVDLCDSNNIYVINEEVFVPWDKTAMLYRSFDGGGFWQPLLLTPDLNYFTGSLSLSPGGVIYLQTAKEGILRSNDNGDFWTTIGGPSGTPDTRLVVAATDDIVYAADNKGSIWMTENSGGFPGGNTTRVRLETSKQFLFAGQEGSICGDTLSDTLVISYPDCPTISLTNAAIQGSITDYSIIRQDGDTIIVRFVPQVVGKRNATLVLLLNGATKQLIPLLGSGSIPDFALSLSAPALFEKDSVPLCDTLVRGIRIRSKGCMVPKVSTQSVGGDYILVTPLPAVLTGDDSITIAFAPRNSGLRSALYTIRFENNKTYTVSLAGVGVDPGPNLSASKAALFDRDAVALCTSARDTFVIRSDVCIGRLVARQGVTGPYAAEYQLHRTVSDLLTGFDTIIISFTPTSAGMRNAVYELVANDSSSIFLPLTGQAYDEGYTIRVVPSSLFDQDTVSLCDTIVRQLVITSFGCNVAGIGSESINGSREYTLLSRLPLTLTGNDTVVISFAPSTTGLRSAVYEFVLTDGKKIGIPLNSSGSEAPYTLSISPLSLFEHDSLFTCESVVRTISMSKAGCGTAKLSSATCSGDAALDYVIVQGPEDSLSGQSSIIIEFRPSTSGQRLANYSLTLEDKSVITIPLLGFGRPTLPLRLVTQQEFIMDTLGGTISVPIKIAGLDVPRSVELSISFDNANLSYLGSRSASGASLDIRGTIQNASSQLFIPASDIVLNGISGYADFLIFADSGMRSRVVISDLRVTDASLPCNYTTGPAVESAIIGPEGCEIEMVSNFLRYGRVPRFSVYPNPTSGQVTIVTSTDAGHIIIEVTDQLGISRKHFDTELPGGKPLQFNVADLPAGLYFVRFIGDTYGSVVPLTLQK